MRNSELVAFKILSCLFLVMMVVPVYGAPTQVLIKNVNIFDGKTDKLAMGQDVLVEGNLIKRIGQGGESPYWGDCHRGRGTHADAGSHRWPCTCYDQCEF